MSREPTPRIRIAHISDLHVGKDFQHTQAAVHVRNALAREKVDRVLVTGDVTQRGSYDEGAAFERIYAPLWDRMTVIPGNHDRATDNYAERITGGERVWVQLLPRSKLYLICCDSTSPWNGALPIANGMLTPRDIEDVISSARLAPKGFLTCVLLHHHVMRSKVGDAPLEVLSDAFGLPFMREVDGGQELLSRLPSTVRLILHGHKHTPSEKHRHDGLSIYNGGSTTELGAFRVFTTEGGNVLETTWVNV